MLRAVDRSAAGRPRSGDTSGKDVRGDVRASRAWARAEPRAAAGERVRRPGAVAAADRSAAVRGAPAGEDAGGTGGAAGSGAGGRARAPVPGPGGRAGRGGGPAARTPDGRRGAAG